MMTGEKNTARQRRAGVLMHISSLPGPGPVGTIGREARAFVDFLQRSGQRVWQVLPLTPAACYYSPYSSHSVFAGNPYFIDLLELEEEGWIPRGSVAALPHRQQDKVDYRVCDRELLPLLRKAFKAHAGSIRQEIGEFRREHGFWLEDYALYMAIHTMQGDISYLDWPQLLALREPSEMRRVSLRMQEQVDFWVYLQYLFFTQWARLKKYANDRGVSIMGDMPIYTAGGSADVWANCDVFQLDHRHRPTHVAGVPPDAFAAEGQRWGNPLYDWDYLAKTGYKWWIDRLQVSAILYDEVRIDHFRALDEYYAIPADHHTAMHGHWHKGPGMDFFRGIRKALPDLKLVAEDLGILTAGVCQLLEDSGLPGMKVLLFAFNPWGTSDYLPHRHIRNCVAYIGTHDNDTALGWLQSGNPDEVRFARHYMALDGRKSQVWGLLQGLHSSVADTAIAQMQDLLELGNSARMNTPGTIGGNWEWRMLPGAADEELADRLWRLTAKHGRL